MTRDTTQTVGRIAAALGLTPSSIGQVRVTLSPFLHGMCGGADIDTAAAAQLSLPYAIAARLVYGEVGMEVFTQERRESPTVDRVLRRVVLDVDASMNANEHPIITVTATDGSEATEQGHDPLGSPTNPMTHEQVTRKFRQLAGRSLPTAQVETLLTAVSGLRDLPDAGIVNDLLRPSGPGNAERPHDHPLHPEVF